MPFRSEFPTASNVGHHVAVVLRVQPARADDAGIRRSHRYLETAITIQDCGVLAVKLQVFVTDEEVRNLLGGYKQINTKWYHQ